MRFPGKYQFSKLLCVMALLFSSMLFTGFTGRTAAIPQTSKQTELLLYRNGRTEKSTAAYHDATTLQQAVNSAVDNPHDLTCFIFHHNRLFNIKLKHTAFLTKQFVMYPLLTSQKTIPSSSPEHIAIL
jgi:hypothetical protein